MASVSASTYHTSSSTEHGTVLSTLSIIRHNSPQVTSLSPSRVSVASSMPSTPSVKTNPPTPSSWSRRPTVTRFSTCLVAGSLKLALPHLVPTTLNFKMDALKPLASSAASSASHNVANPSYVPTLSDFMLRWRWAYDPTPACPPSS